MSDAHDTETLAEVLAEVAFWREQEAGNTRRDRGGYYASGWKDGYAARIEQARAGEDALRERIEEALAYTSKQGVSCGGLSVDAEGCFAGDLAGRVRAVLADTAGDNR